MMGVYYKPLNFHLKHLSEDRNNHLLFLVKASLIKSLGIKCVLQPLIDELNELFFVGADINGTIFHVIACAFTGDNLASNLVGGFTTSFASGNFCRHCTVSSADALSSFIETNFEKRTHETILSDHVTQSNGIINLSPFSELCYVNLALFYPPDIMHDTLEGVSHLVMSSLFKDLLDLGIFSIDELNCYINKHTAISSAIRKTHVNNCRLPLNAATMLRLALQVPGIFGFFYASEENPIWELVLVHSEILEIIFSPFNLSPLAIDCLRLAIFRQNELLVNLYEHPKYKCKLHNLIHYPSLMKLYGNLFLFSTMRFEAMHQFFKDLIRRTKQFVNVPLTLSYRFQRRKCIILSMPLSTIPVSKFNRLFDFDSLNLYQKACVLSHLRIPAISEELSVTCAKELKYGGFVFTCKKSAIVLNVCEIDFSPDFWIVENILHFQNDWILMIRKIQTSYEVHFRSYIIDQFLETYGCVHPKAVIHFPLEVFSLNDFQAIRLKHFIFT